MSKYEDATQERLQVEIAQSLQNIGRLLRAKKRAKFKRSQTIQFPETPKFVPEAQSTERNQLISTFINNNFAESISEFTYDCRAYEAAPSGPEILIEEQVPHMSPEEIKAGVEERQRRAVQMNFESTEVDFAFLFFFNQLFERACVRMNDAATLNYLCEVFVSRLNNKFLKLSNIKEGTAVNAQSFVWKLLPSEIGDTTSDMLNQLDLEELMQIDGNACIRDQPQ